MKIRHFKDECWDANFWLVWPVQNAELNAFLKRQFKTSDPDLPDGAFTGRCVEINDDENGRELGFVIALAGWSGTPEDHATLVHEAFHVTHYALSNRGLKLYNKTDEAYCYLLDSIVRRCLEFLK